ncbi:MAG TPA: hypothetical protein VFX30_09155 [bacterium]|nr:hypothetical protein [bacterium]
MDPKYLPFVIIPGFLILFPLFWMAVVFLISRISGWAGMAKRYRLEGGEFPNRRYGSASIRIANYKGVLRVGHDRKGLYLGVNVLFRAGHPNLFIPWRDVTEIRQESGFLRKVTRIVIKDGPNIALYGEWPELERERA